MAIGHIWGKADPGHLMLMGTGNYYKAMYLWATVFRHCSIPMGSAYAKKLVTKEAHWVSFYCFTRAYGLYVYIRIYA